MPDSEHARRPGRTLAACLVAAGLTGPARADQLDVPAEFATIQSAIDAASPGDVVAVAPGTYHESLYLWVSGVTLRGAGAATTTLDGAGLGAPIVWAPAGGAAVTVVEGFTFTNGEGGLLDNCVGARAGGAIYAQGCSLAVRDCRFYRNAYHVPVSTGGAIYAYLGTALVVERCSFEENGLGPEVGKTAFGGAVGACQNLGDTVLIADSTFAGNQASHGAGIWCQDGDLTVQGCVFTGNQASSGGGLRALAGRLSVSDSSFTGNTGVGAVYASGSPAVSIAGCVFSANQGSQGAGVRLRATEGETSITDCRFEQNTASQGGGLYLEAASTATVAGCEFTGNEASFGGGLYAASSLDSLGFGGSVTVEACTFAGNRAGFGGGMHGRAEVTTAAPALSPPSIALLNSVFTGNSAEACCGTGLLQNSCYLDGVQTGTYYGGGADLRESSGGLIRVAGCLFAGNTGTTAGGLHAAVCGGSELGGHAGGTVRISNVTAVGNAPDGLHLRLSDSGAVVVANSVVRGNTAQQIATTGQPSISVGYSNVQGGFGGTGNIDADPLFVAAATGDYRLSAGSPSIDAGNRAAVPAELTTDLDGRPRFVDDPGRPDTGAGSPPMVDMGAYEFQRPPCPADFDQQNGVQVADIFAFLRAWFANSSSADFDGMNGIQVADIFAFLRAWFAGC